ncbi:hypothetical protein HOY80DRAFT_375214 [Tuber brumale]|nr:hypothetical protein HOY80DRAFT_375214 [Tuber brumale]
MMDRIGIAVEIGIVCEDFLVLTLDFYLYGSGKGMHWRYRTSYRRFISNCAIQSSTHTGIVPYINTTPYTFLLSLLLLPPPLLLQYSSIQAEFVDVSWLKYRFLYLLGPGEFIIGTSFFLAWNQSPPMGDSLYLLYSTNLDPRRINLELYLPLIVALYLKSGHLLSGVVIAVNRISRP